jgi:glutamyl/glutaminyl-tRNA synthetase
VNPSYRGRVAPTPTGLLHLGHARTFFTAFRRARDAGGTLILRNEDLDPQRCRAEFTDAMYEDLRWLGISWDEGPDTGGPFAPYTQSQRRDHYRQALQTLRDRGFVYPCTCSRKDLNRIAQAPHEDAADSDEGPLYPGTCRPSRTLPGPSGIADRLSLSSHSEVNWRFQVPDGEVVGFEDAHFGPQRFIAGCDFADFLVWRRDDVPSYQLAVVADDAAMHITEVVRGADLLLSTARQLLLYRALSLQPPLWHHCPLLLDDRGQRLAKRHDALSIRSLRQQGRTPESLLAETAE